MLRIIVTLAAVAALSGCSGNVTGVPAPTHWRTFHGVPVAVVGGEPQLFPETLASLELAGVDTSNRANLRALILREAK